MKTMSLQHTAEPIEQIQKIDHNGESHIHFLLSVIPLKVSEYPWMNTSVSLCVCFT